RDLGVLHLARPAFAAQLPHRLRDRKDRSRMAGMAMREQPAVRVDWQLATELDKAAFDEGPALTLLAKAEVLELDNHDRREAVVNLRHVDILRSHPGHRIGAFTSVFRRRRDEAVGLTDVL